MTRFVSAHGASPCDNSSRLDSGPRLGGDRDEDLVLDGDDCAPGDPGSWAPTVTIADLVLEKPGVVTLSWSDQGGVVGPGLTHAVLGGDLSVLRTLGIDATACVDGPIQGTTYDDLRPDPTPGDGYFYLIRATNGCGAATLGAGRGTADAAMCP